VSAPELPGWLSSAHAGLEQYADLLATTGVTAGLIGPREVPRLWSRHILNCAVVVEPTLPFVPQGSTVVDIGSGAGLPGLVWALVRPDLQVTCLEPLLRRSTFLEQVVADLGLGDRVTVLRDRAESITKTWPGVDIATSRAVAPLPKLLGWSMPLVHPGGRLVAMKGANAPVEVAEAQGEARALGAINLEVATCGADLVDPPTTLVLATRPSVA
jgi:16S rRNA (guanine527-N7)-methyltransferase